MNNRFQPLDNRVLVIVQKKTEPEKTEAGLLKMDKKPTVEAIVFSVGPGTYARETGVFMSTVLGKGDLVLIGADGGMPLEVENEEGKLQEMKLLREDDVLMLIKKKESVD